MAAAFVLSQLAALPDALLALWLMLLGQGVLEHRPGMVQGAAHRAGTLDGGDVVSAHHQYARAAALSRPGDHRARIARSAATGVDRHRGAPGAAGVSRPPVDAAQPGVRAGPHVHVRVLDARLDPAAGRDDGAAGIDSPGVDPAAGLCGPDGVDVDLAAGRRAGRAGERGTEQPAGAAPVHIATTAAPGKEVRVTGIGERLVAERRAAWDRWYGPVAATRRGSAFWHALAWAIFGLGYVGAVVFVSSGLGAPAAQVLLVLAAGARLSAYIGATVGEIGFLRGFWMDGSRRLAWLEDYAASVAAPGELPVPAVLQRGIRLEHVSFAYPGTSARGAGGCVPDSAGRRGGCRSSARTVRARPPWSSCWRKCTSRRRARSCWTRRRWLASAGRRMARAAGGRISGFLPFRIPGGAHRRAGRPSPHGRRAGGARGGGSCRCRATLSARLASRDSIRNSVRPGRAVSSSPSASGRSSRWRAASCGTSRCC